MSDDVWYGTECESSSTRAALDTAASATLALARRETHRAFTGHLEHLGATSDTHYEVESGGRLPVRLYHKRISSVQHAVAVPVENGSVS